MKSGKKIFWVIFVLVLIAAVLAIVFVSLFRNKNTNELAKTTNSYVSGGYLDDGAQQYEKIQEYLSNIDTSDFSSEELTELENFKNGYDACTTIAKFFNRQTYFMEYSNAYKNNRKNVEGKLKSAQRYSNALVSKIESNTKIVSGVKFWEKLAWTNCRKEMKNMLKNTIEAFKIYSRIYQGSVSSRLLNNDYSDVIFLGLSDLSDKFVEGYQNVNGIGLNLKNYAEIYFVTAGEQQILGYVYLEKDSASTIRATIQDIKENGKESEFFAAFLTAMPI